MYWNKAWKSWVSRSIGNGIGWLLIDLPSYILQLNFIDDYLELFVEVIIDKQQVNFTSDYLPLFEEGIVDVLQVIFVNDYSLKSHCLVCLLMITLCCLVKSLLDIQQVIFVYDKLKLIEEGIVGIV